MKKRGMELVISTLVVIILAVMMLVLGSLLVRSTVCNAKKGVDLMSDFSQQEIQSLFSEQEDGTVAVKEINNEIPKKTYYGVGFVIKNELKSASENFRYTIEVLDLQDCPITEAEARSYILTQRTSTVTIAGGSTHSDVIEFKIPKEAPLCSLKYKIDVQVNGEIYGSSAFVVRIKEPPFFNSVMC